MPQLDLSEALTDPLTLDTFAVRRRTSAVNNKGRNAPVVTVTDPVYGVVDAASPNDLERLPDNQRMGRYMTIVTRFALQGPSPGNLPDEVVWAGDTFVVEHVDPYKRYGTGFVQAIICSTDVQDAPPANA